MKDILGGFKKKVIEFLRKTEKYTKTDMVYVLRGGFWSFFSQGIGSFSSFVIVVLLANLLPKEVFGQYRFVLSIISILTIFTLPGLGVSVTRSFARGDIVDLPKIVKIKINWGFIGSLVTLILAMYYFYNNNIEITYALILSAFFLPFIEAYTIYSAYYKGKQDFKTPAIYESISRIFQAIVIIITALITHNIIFILGAYLVGQVISRLFFYKKTLRDEKANLNIENIQINEDNESIKYGKYLSGTQIIDIISSNVDKLLVWHFLGAELLAVYYVALTIPKNIVLFCNIIPRIAFPKFSQSLWSTQDRSRVLYKLLLFSVLLVVPAVLYVVFVPLVIPIIFKGYSISINTSILLSLLIILLPLNAIIGQILQAQKVIRKIIIFQIMTLVSFIIAFACLYNFFGASVIIAALAFIFSQTISLLVGVIFVRR